MTDDQLKEAALMESLKEMPKDIRDRILNNPQLMDALKKIDSTVDELDLGDRMMLGMFSTMHMVFTDLSFDGGPGKEQDLMMDTFHKAMELFSLYIKMETFKLVMTAVMESKMKEKTGEAIVANMSAFYNKDLRREFTDTRNQLKNLVEAVMDMAKEKEKAKPKED
jgi:hypothetical protein